MSVITIDPINLLIIKILVKTMKNAIINMARAFGLMLLLVVVLLLWGCGLTRHVKSDMSKQVVNKTKTDSTAVADTQQVLHNEVNNIIRTSIDSVGTVPGEEVNVALEALELKPVTDAAGNKQGRTFTADNGHIHATVTVSKQGSVNVRCKEDSFRLVLYRYRSDSISLVKTIDCLSIQHATGSHNYTADSAGVNVRSEVIIKGAKRSWFGRIWQGAKNVFAVIGLVWFVFFIVGFFRKVVI